MKKQKITNSNLSLTEFNRIENFKSLKITLNTTFSIKVDKEILYLLQKDNNLDEMYFRHFLFLNGEKAIYSWTHGMITNFSEVLKRYVNDRANKLQLNIFKINWTKINGIFLSTIPASNSSLFIELTLLKRVLNIPLIAFINIDDKRELSLCEKNILYKEHNPFVNIPLYYSNTNNEYVSKELLYQLTLKELGMKNKMFN